MEATKILLVLISVCLVPCRSNFESDEDSGSIEIPDRPENRQEGRSQNVQKQDKSFLDLVSKLMGSFQNLLQNKTGKKSNWKFLIQKAKKALNSVNKAYTHVDKARKKLLKSF